MITERARKAPQPSQPEVLQPVLSALQVLEEAVSACPAGPRRRATVDLVVSRVRRLAQAPKTLQAAAEQFELEELLRSRSR